MQKRNYLIWILFIIFQGTFLLKSIAHAEEDRAVFLMNDLVPEDLSQNKNSESAGNSEEMVLEFDPTLLNSELVQTSGSSGDATEPASQELPTHKRDRLLYESKRMRHYKYQSKLKREIVIPNSIEDLTLLAKIDQLTIAEQNLFFAKKEAFLNKVARLGRLIHMSNKNTNRLTHLFNKMMFTNAPLVVRSIRSKTTMALGISIGVGFSDKILEKIKAMLRLSHVPDISGFYLMTSVGLTLEYVETNGKKRWRFSSMNLENRWATEIYSPFVIAAGGIAVTYMNSTKIEDSAVEKGEIFHTSLANLNQSPTEYGLTSRLFTPLIPGGAIAVFKGDYANYKLSPMGFAELFKDSFKFLWPSHRNQCIQSLNIKI